MKSTETIASAVGVLAAALALAACGGGDGEGKAAAGKGAGLPRASEKVELDPADFTTNIDNPYWPMRPGNRWVYNEADTEDNRERVVVEVTKETKRIANGISARVVRDTVSAKGRPVEVTHDWFAQDRAGNIWYLGEHVTNYESGRVVDHPARSRRAWTEHSPGSRCPPSRSPGCPIDRSS